MDSNKLVRLSDLKNLLGNIDRRTIDRWEETENFPRRIKLGSRFNAWRLKEVEDWIKGRQVN